MTAALCAALAAAACGGTNPGPGNNNNSIYCETEDQCPPGWECTGNVCVQRDGGAPPDVVVGDPDITVDPMTVDFGSALLGVAVSETVTITNDGAGPLTIFSITLEDDGGNGELTAQPTGSLNQVLQPTETLTVTVELTNLDAVANAGRLLISSDDPDEALVQVDLLSELKGNSDIMTCVMESTDFTTHCVDDPEVIDFGTLTFDASGFARVAITNQGDGNMPLVISDIYVSNGSGHANLFHLEVLEVVESATGLAYQALTNFPSEAYLLSSDDGLGAPEVLLVEVRFQAILDGQPVPNEDLIIESNDPLEAAYPIPFQGTILCPADHYDYDSQPGCEYECAMTNGSVESCDGLDNNCDGNIDEGVNPGLCQVCDPSGAPVTAVDDLVCGAIDCSAWYEQVGTVGPTDTDYCYGHEPLTHDRCEGANDCKDANTDDCAGQPRLAAPALTCGICQYVDGCNGATAGTCANYAPNTPTTLCRGCDGAGNDGTVADDVDCGTIDCSGWYTRQGTASPTGTDTCHGREDITTDRCEGSADCKDDNTDDCTPQPALASAAVSCGTCKRVAGCLGSIAGYCENYPEYTPTIRCTECDSAGGTRMRADDPICGTIDCAGWYSKTGTASTTGTEQCFGHQNITTNRCEGTDDCKDPNSADCSAMGLLGTAQATCGLCKFMNGCTNTTEGSCEDYPGGSKTQLCGICNGGGLEIAAGDDDACNTIDCSGWYTKSGTAGVATTESCYPHVDITAGRCEGLNDCKDDNTDDCATQATEGSPATVCGVCKYMSGCSGTVAGSCVPYPDDTPAPGGTCGLGECVASYMCQGGVAECTPGTPTSDEPDTAFLDTNCDGYDGDLSNAILVATWGADTSTCGISTGGANPVPSTTPCATVNYGVGRAVSTSRSHVYIQAGTYDEVVTLQSGISLYGGYDSNWDRDLRTQPGHTVTINGGYDGSTGQYMTIKAISLTGTSVIADLYLNGPNASGTVSSRGKSSYTVYARSTNDLQITRVTIDAGNGDNGNAGSTGASASQTRPSTAGNGGNAREYTTNCNTSRQPGGTAGSNGSCSSNSYGGTGGQGGQMDTSCGWTGFCSNCAATSGLNGASGAQYSVGGVGYRGAGSGTCTSGGGGDGNNGRVSNGGGGGGAGSYGQISNYFWYGKNGSTGSLGVSGGGGGGGGGSGGCDSGTDSYGAGGGGGGAGGCRAPTAGGYGYGAGGSFGVFGYSATVTVTNSTVIRGTGGTGGTGGQGRYGQPGGYGGNGGNGDGDSGPGGDGGDGGRGGHSGGGGGGAGGHSYGIYSYNSTVSQSGNTFSSGALGAGGGGGWSPGTDGYQGNTGSLGTVGTCSSTSGC